MTPFDRLPTALASATELHEGQVRKGSNVPYISHLMGVAAIALEYGANEDQAIAALLHDALEDGPEYSNLHSTTIEACIEQQYGPEVLRLVWGATDEAASQGAPKRPWLERKAAYLDSLCDKDNAQLLVVMSDKLYNARTILADLRCHGPEVFDRFTSGLTGTLAYYRALSNLLTAITSERAAPRLQDLAHEIEEAVSATEYLCGTSKTIVQQFRVFYQLLQLT